MTTTKSGYRVVYGETMPAWEIAPRIVYGQEHFTDKAECEAHAIRVAYDFAHCRACNKKHAFTVTTQGSRQ